MSEPAAQSSQLPKPKLSRRAQLRRGVYILPSLFTVGTLVCGYYAILATLRGTQVLAAGLGIAVASAAFDNASKAIGWAIVFDGLDGRIARLTNSTSNFGREFDSLADVITFGIAPAFLAYAWGIRILDNSYAVVPHLRPLGWIITFGYLICGAARLARFNIDTIKPSTDRRFFVGLPIPAAAGVIAALVHWAKYPLSHWAFGAIWLGGVGSLAFLMVSRIRYFSFKGFDLRRRRSYQIIIVMGLIIWAVASYSEPVLLTMALVYAISGPLGRITGKVRPTPPAPEEVHAA